MERQLDTVARLMAEHNVPPSPPDGDWKTCEKNPDVFRYDCALLLPSFQPAYVQAIGGAAN